MKTPDYKELTDEDIEMIKTELEHEFNRQEDLQTERARRIEECDPQRLLPRIEVLENKLGSSKQNMSSINMYNTLVALGDRVESLEQRASASEEIMKTQNNNMERIIAVLENMKIRSK